MKNYIIFIKNFKFSKFMYFHNYINIWFIGIMCIITHLNNEI